jgi:2-polyprenyl-3-methyl-5-hydroxy-6-metoxy-1,4-benzoquinol methylase
MLEIGQLSEGLHRRPDGIWVARNVTPVSYPQEASDRYREIEDASFWFAHRNACIVAAARAFPPDGALFDVGGGNGVVSLALQRAGFPVALVEPSLEGAQNSRERGIDEVICASLEDSGFHPQTLPAVGLFDVVEHLEDDVAFLRTVARLLRPDGRVYLSVPAYNFLWSAQDDYAGHQRRYTRRSLVRALESAGFSIELCTYIFTLLPLPIFALRTIPSRLGLRNVASRQHEANEHRGSQGFLASLLNFVLRFELVSIQKGVALPFGGSCLAVARLSGSTKK